MIIRLSRSNCVLFPLLAHYASGLHLECRLLCRHRICSRRALFPDWRAVRSHLGWSDGAGVRITVCHVQQLFAKLSLCNVRSFRVRCRHKYTLQSLLWFAVVRQLLPNTNTHTDTHQTHTDTHPSHTHSLETGCFQAYARIDGAFVCSVQSWHFEASLCLLFKAASQQQHTTWCNMVFVYKIWMN